MKADLRIVKSIQKINDTVEKTKENQEKALLSNFVELAQNCVII